VRGFLHGAWAPAKYEKIELFQHHQTRSARLRQIVREWPAWLTENPEAEGWVMEELL
jgi:hypothetical protein